MTPSTHFTYQRHARSRILALQIAIATVTTH
jgi:hypothetical protein